MSARCLLFAALLASATACGDDAVTPPIDAAADTTTPPDAALEVVPEAPMPPALPDAGECPGGWQQVEVAGGTACEPWDESGPGCEGTDVRFPGDAACGPLGSTCPARFPDDVTGPALYVEVGASGGDGTVDAPLGTIAEAVALSAPGETIVLAAGRYVEEVTLPDGVSLRGACTAETIIEGAVGELSTGTVVLGEASSARDLTILGLRPGLRVNGVTASARDVRVEGDGVGVTVIGGATFTADGLAVVGTTGALGVGIFILSGSTATIERAYFDDNRTFGIAIGDEASSLGLRRSVVMRTRVDVDGFTGVGLVARTGAEAIVEECVLRENHASGVNIQDGGLATIRRSVFRANLGQVDGLLGMGLVVALRAMVVVERALFERNKAAAIAILGVGSHLEGSDLLLVDTLRQGDADPASIGLIVAMGGTAELDRALVDGAEGLGVSVSAFDSTLVARDLVVRGIDPRPSDMAGGRGIDIETNGSVDVSRLLIEEVHGSAILITDVGSEAMLTDLHTRQIRADARTRSTGRGLTLQFGGSMNATRVLIDAARDAGILAYGEGAMLVASEIAVDGTLPRECVVDTCMDNGSGTGVSAAEGAMVELMRFRVADSALAGLQIARGARLTARDGLVARNTVGVNAQDESFDVSDVSMGVSYVDNGINLDSRALPVPEPSER